MRHKKIYNKVYLIGAGPGKSDLASARTINILKQADVIIYDYLVGTSLLKYADKDAEFICCDKLARKGSFSDGIRIRQENIHNLVIKKVKQGKKVARLKNGDPFLFGRTSEELKALAKNKIRFEIVPGIPASIAASSLSGIPLTDRDLASSCGFITAQEARDKNKSALNWPSLAKLDTLVVYMGVKSIDNVSKNLVRAGKDHSTPCAVIKDVSLLTEQMIKGRLDNISSKIKKSGITPPAIIIIGKVVKLENAFNWSKRTKRVLFTGLSKERFFEDSHYVHLPLIKIVPMEDYHDFDICLKTIEDFDWIVFLSRYAVIHFFKRLEAIKKDARQLSGIKIACIGSSTKQKLLEFGIIADLVPKEESSRGLVNKFKKIAIKNSSIFLPRSDIADKGLASSFKKLGAHVTTGFAYKNIMPDDLPDIDLKSFDEIIFTSPSTVRNFKKRYKLLPRAVKARFIGEITRMEAKRCKL